MQSYISHRRGRVFNPLIFFFFFVIILLYWFVTKNIGNYRKYDIFFNFRFTENMIFPSNAENLKNMTFTFSVFMKMLFFMQCDRWCYLVIGCFNWKIGAFQHSVGKLSLQLLSHIFIEIHIHSWVSHFYRYLFILVYFHFL